jgi:hypothetical protein
MLNHVATRWGEDARDAGQGPARRAKACGSCHRHFTVQPYMDVADLPAQVVPPEAARRGASTGGRTPPGHVVLRQTARRTSYGSQPN